MILQQFGGVNGIAFYASSIFISAGKCIFFLMLLRYEDNIKLITQLS